MRIPNTPSLITDTGVVEVKLKSSGATSLAGKDPRIRPEGLVKTVATVTMKEQKPLQMYLQFDNVVKK